MKPATRALHQALIRCAKSAIAAWEAWLKAGDDDKTNGPTPAP